MGNEKERKYNWFLETKNTEESVHGCQLSQLEGTIGPHIVRMENRITKIISKQANRD